MDDHRRDNHQRVLHIIQSLETHGISCHHNEERENSPPSSHHHDHKDPEHLEEEYRDHLDNSRVYVIAITKKCIDRIRGHGVHGMRDLAAQEFEYILSRKGPTWMIPVIMDVSSKNTMRWFNFLYLF